MKLFIIVITVLISFPGISQVLDNRMGSAFTDKPFFNEDFIKENKLKRLNGTFTYKKRGDVLKPTEFKYVYEFNREGQLISTYETRTDDGSVDTSWNKYYYDENDQLVRHSKSDQDGFTTIIYGYDSLGRVISEEYVKDIDSNGVVLRSLSFNKERIAYADYGSQIKKTRYNNYDLPYLDEFLNYNDLGYLTERIEKIKMTSTVYTYHYSYNEKGKLSAIRKTSNQSDEVLEELKFSYDELGNLMEKHIYKKGVFTTDIQILYSPKTGLLDSVITRQVSTNFMLILRFLDYEFYD